MKKKTGLKCVAFAGGRIFKEMPLEAREIESRIDFASFLNEHFYLKTLSLHFFTYKHVM